ncbi:MAG TPA: stage II sporulation protein M [Peptococcaceae bacterium]|jgi:stage II sporulation protein M|nr:stage II sporulation protein M [Peptococcaceae bacterium]
MAMRWKKASVAINIQKDFLVPVVMAIGFFLCGIILGALTLHSLNPVVQQELHQFMTLYIEEASDFSGEFISNLQSWGNILKTQAGTLFLLWIFGVTMVGSPLVLFALGARGFIIGFTVGYLVQQEAGKGLALALAGVLPQNLCYVPAFVGAGAVALYFSITLLRRQHAPLNRLGVYSLIFLFFLLLIVLGSWLEAYLVPLLLHLIAPFFQ